MAKINDYYQKRQLMDQLAEELEALENDQALKDDLKFEESIRQLMKDFDKTPRNVFEILAAIDPNIASKPAANSSRAKRTMMVYKNPHTGEIVETRGGNHKTLKQWREKYGREAVDSWRS